MKTRELTMLMVAPGKHPKVTKIKNDLDSLQKAVSIGADYQGLMEFVSLGNGDCIMCNEEGKLIGLDGKTSCDLHHYAGCGMWQSDAQRDRTQGS